MDSIEAFGLDRYRRMRERNQDVNRALARTNIAVRCWLHRIQSIPGNVEELRAKHRRMVIDKAAIAALGQRWRLKCTIDNCRHHADADIYLTLYQIITLLLCMGYISDAILGTFVDCSEYGHQNENPSHPLRLAGIFTEPCFSNNYFEIGPTNRSQNAFAWVHRSTGDLLLANGREMIPGVGAVITSIISTGALVSPGKLLDPLAHYPSTLNFGAD
jgi:hypothetical protein